MRLEHYIILDVAVTTTPDYQAPAAGHAYQLTFGHTIDPIEGQPDRYGIRLNIALTPEKSDGQVPYDVKLSMVGYFSMSPELSTEDVKGQLGMFGISVLFS